MDPNPRRADQLPADLSAVPAPPSTPADPLDSAPAPTNPVQGSEPPPRPRPSLLVVDDEPEVLRSVYDLLRIDYQVVTCASGPRALDVLRSAEDIHVIMTDQRMPEMTGVELLRQAKAIRPETTRLLFTAYADIRTVIDAINQGHVFRYLAKPWDPEELEAVVRQGVEHHNLIVEKNRLLGELQAANAKLTEANRLKGAFLEVASHELNTPVTVVLGMIELWKMTQGQDALSAERQWIDRIGAAAQRLARTVERMLKLVRSGDFGRPLERESVAIEPLLRRAIDELAPYLELRRQSVTVAVEPGLAPIEGDADKLADVLINLLANAIKFTPDGDTIQVAAGSEPAAPGWIRFRVSDQGVGVPPGDQQYLFEPFFTGFDTLRHSSGDYQFGKRGIGLGLWLVKTFVELHGGRVEVASIPGRGSTFSFLLPQSQAAALASAAPPAPLAGPVRG
ncbi:MAG TPA: hybrid sensor histidine kinase/response regulator [Isosphaeraceae bacterium]|nr:hybrid sensor histidine kinase/response regulator [Isosphaeraceae bacterium]